MFDKEVQFPNEHAEWMWDYAQEAMVPYNFNVYKFQQWVINVDKIGDVLNCPMFGYQEDVGVIEKPVVVNEEVHAPPPKPVTKQATIIEQKEGPTTRASVTLHKYSDKPMPPLDDVPVFEVKCVGCLHPEGHPARRDVEHSTDWEELARRKKLTAEQLLLDEQRPDRPLLSVAIQTDRCTGCRPLTGKACPSHKFKPDEWERPFVLFQPVVAQPPKEKEETKIEPPQETKLEKKSPVLPKKTKGNRRRRQTKKKVVAKQAPKAP